MKRMLFALLAALLLTGCAPANTPEPTETSGQTTPESIAAPDVTVYTADGQAVKLSDFFGKPIVLNFWASWCGPCKAEMPDFDKIYGQMGSDVQFLMVNLTDGRNETLETATDFVQNSGYSFPVYYDTDTDAAAKYGIRSIPTTYFIDRDGNIVTGANDMLSEESLLQGISLIAE